MELFALNSLRFEVVAPLLDALRSTMFLSLDIVIFNLLTSPGQMCKDFLLIGFD